MTTNDRYALAMPAELRHYAFLPPAVPAPLVLNGTVNAVHDGDTFTLEADLTRIFGIRMVKIEVNVRILAMAARELKDPGGVEAQINLESMILGKPVVIASMGADKWNLRTDAVVTYLDASGRGADLATDLITNVWAVPWNGKGIQPKPPWPRP